MQTIVFFCAVYTEIKDKFGINSSHPRIIHTLYDIQSVTDSLCSPAPVKSSMKQQQAVGSNCNIWSVFQHTLKTELQENIGFFWPFAFWWLHTEKYGLWNYTLQSTPLYQSIFPSSSHSTLVQQRMKSKGLAGCSEAARAVAMGWNRSAPPSIYSVPLLSLFASHPGSPGLSLGSVSGKMSLYHLWSIAAVVPCPAQYQHRAKRSHAILHLLWALGATSLWIWNECSSTGATLGLLFPLLKQMVAL